jgi:hypothetical protein
MLLGVVTATLSGATPTLPPAPGHRPAGCHGHGQPSPPPVPVSHTCCEAGHQTAILQEATQLRPSLAYFSSLADRPESLIAPHAIKSPSNLLISSSFDPILVPLRI